MQKLLLTPEEAASVLSIGRSKVYELLRTGAIDSVRIGGSRRIRVDSLTKFIDAVAAEPESLRRSA